MNLKLILKSLKLHESTVSMILGFVVIVVAGVLLVNYFSGRRGQTIPPLEIGDESKQITHAVAAGEDLWTVSKKYYGTGYNWVDIAQQNNIQNPNQIEEGQLLIIPSVAPRLAEAQISPNAVLPTEEVQLTTEVTKIPTPTTVKEQPATTTQVPSEQSGVHTVQKGENLWKIAESAYGSGYNWVDIAQENNLKNPGVITEGQSLVLPQVETKTPTVITKKVEPISGATYAVQKGDNLWSIAVRAYGDGYKWVQIANENHLAHPSIIHQGNDLTLPR